MNVHPEPTESEVQEAYFQTLAKLDPSAEMARVIERAKADLARRAVVPEPEGDAVERAALTIRNGLYQPSFNRDEMDESERDFYIPIARAALEAAAVVPVQTPPEAIDPYAECVCSHGRHTHVHYTGACGLCACPAVRPAPAASPVPSREAIATAERVENWLGGVRNAGLPFGPVTDDVARDLDAVLALWGTPTEPTTEQEHKHG